MAIQFLLLKVSHQLNDIYTNFKQQETIQHLRKMLSFLIEIIGFMYSTFECILLSSMLILKVTLLLPELGSA
jgi:hypothetical protein